MTAVPTIFERYETMTESLKCFIIDFRSFPDLGQSRMSIFRWTITIIDHVVSPMFSKSLEKDKIQKEKGWILVKIKVMKVERLILFEKEKVLKLKVLNEIPCKFPSTNPLSMQLLYVEILFTRQLDIFTFFISGLSLSSTLSKTIIGTILI